MQIINFSGVTFFLLYQDPLVVLQSFRKSYSLKHIFNSCADLTAFLYSKFQNLLLYFLSLDMTSVFWRRMASCYTKEWLSSYVNWYTAGIRHNQIILTKTGFAHKTAERIIQVYIHALIKRQIGYFLDNIPFISSCWRCSFSHRILKVLPRWQNIYFGREVSCLVSSPVSSSVTRYVTTQ